MAIATRSGTPARTVFQKYADKSIFDVVWAPDDRGLLMIYQRGFLPGNAQIGFVPYPEGNFRTVTNDTNSYRDITLSADGKILVTAHIQVSHELDLLPGTGGDAKLSISGISKRASISDVAWVSDEQLLISLNDRIVQMATDGTHQVTLLNEASSEISFVAVCDNSPFLILSRSRSRGRIFECGFQQEPSYSLANAMSRASRLIELCGLMAYRWEAADHEAQK